MHSLAFASQLSRAFRESIARFDFEFFPKVFSSLFRLGCKAERKNVANLLFLCLSRKWRTNWKRYSESSSRSGIASSSKTAESPDWKSRWPRWPCKRRSEPKDRGQILKKKRKKKTKKNGLHFNRRRPGCETRPTFQSNLFIFSSASKFALYPDTKRKKKKKKKQTSHGSLQKRHFC